MPYSHWPLLVCPTAKAVVQPLWNWSTFTVWLFLLLLLHFLQIDHKRKFFLAIMLFAYIWTLNCYNVRLRFYWCLQPIIYLTFLSMCTKPHDLTALLHVAQQLLGLLLGLLLLWFCLSVSMWFQIWAISISALSSPTMAAPSVGWILLNTLQSLTVLGREAWAEDWPSILKWWCYIGCQRSHRLCWLSLQWIQRKN